MSHQKLKDAFNADQAKQLLEANAALLVRKVKRDKKPLSRQEVAMISAVVGRASSEWANSQVELAKVFGVDRKSVQRWMKMDGNPGRRSDGRYNIAEWRAWRESRGGADDASPSSPDVAQRLLKADNLLLQNERLKFKVGILKRDYWPADQVELWGANLGTQIRTIVSQLHLAAADLVGLSAAECEKILKQKEDEILDQLHGLKEEMIQYKEGAGTEE